MLKKFILIAFVLFSATSVIAQGTPGDGGGAGAGNNEPGGNLDPGTGTEPQPEGGGVPVDGGLTFLLAAGVGYGAKKAYDYRKNKVKSEK